ncbi:glutathione S-transferase-like protein [Lactarius vividus]|nr:glutathione S-transferase-like protein [Lactarius vividus]
MEMAIRRLQIFARSFTSSSIARTAMSSTESPKPIVLYTAATPNGFKVSTFLEELRAQYGGPDYETVRINLSENVQKEPWYIKLNPNGRIPVISDRSRDNFNDHVFWFDPTETHYSEMVQWIFFAHGGVGPMQGQAGFFTFGTKEDIPFARERYVNETKRLYGVLEIRLSDRDYLAGPGRGKPSIADFNVFPWIAGHARTIAKTLDEWPNLKAWYERISTRKGVQAGLQIPPKV